MTSPSRKTSTAASMPCDPSGRPLLDISAIRDDFLATFSLENTAHSGEGTGGGGGGEEDGGIRMRSVSFLDDRAPPDRASRGKAQRLPGLSSSVAARESDRDEDNDEDEDGASPGRPSHLLPPRPGMMLRMNSTLLNPTTSSNNQVTYPANHAPALVGGGMSTTASQVGKLTRKATARIRDSELDEMINEYSGQTAVTSRRDERRVQVEETLLKSNKIYLRQPIERKIAKLTRAQSTVM